VFETIGRFGSAMKSHYRRKQILRMLDGLPPEIQKDIGWPSQSHHGKRDDLLAAMRGTAR